MAPEVLSRGVYNYKADIWSIGTILFEMIAGYSPFKQAQNKDQLKRQQKSALTLPPDVHMSRECISFINHCLTYNAYKRPSWEELRNHRFIRNGGSRGHTGPKSKRGESNGSSKSLKHDAKRSGSRGGAPFVPESLISTSQRLLFDASDKNHHSQSLFKPRKVTSETQKFINDQGIVSNPFAQENMIGDTEKDIPQSHLINILKMNQKPTLLRDDFDNVNELTISDEGLNKLPSSNIKHNISNVNSNGIC